MSESFRSNAKVKYLRVAVSHPCIEVIQVSEYSPTDKTGKEAEYSARLLEAYGRCMIFIRSGEITCRNEKKPDIDSEEDSDIN